MGRRRSDQGTDALRLLAALFVVVIHVADPTTTAGLCWDAAARFSVPVFVIVSGWYLLDRDGGGLARRGARLLGQMVCWSAVYLVYNMWRYGYEPTGLRGVGRYLLTQPPHLWYLWAIAGLYLLTPLLRPLHRAAGRGLYRYALALCFLFGCVCVTLVRTGHFPALAEILDRTKLPYGLGFVFLYLLGGYLRRFGLGRPWAWALCAVGGTAVTVGMVLWAARDGGDWAWAGSFFAPWAALAGAGAFAAVQGAARGRPWPGARLLARLAGWTLGVYLMHPLVVDVLRHAGVHSAWLLVLVGFALSLAVTAVLSRVPGVRRVV